MTLAEAASDTMHGGLLVLTTEGSTGQNVTTGSVTASQGSSSRSALSSRTPPVPSTTPNSVTVTCFSLNSSTYYTGAVATTAALCTHASDPQNTCTAIADGPGWCVCGTSPNSYPVQTSMDPECGWTTLPPTTSFDCPAATITPLTTIPPATTGPAPLTPPATPPNAGIAIWLQQYTNTNGYQVGTWSAYTYKPRRPETT